MRALVNRRLFIPKKKKECVKAVTSWKKPVLRGVLLIIIVCGIAAVCLLTRPKQERYTFRIIIPAGTRERFVYSEEEIRATKSTIRIWLNGGLGDTEVLLAPVEETMETGYTAVYLTQGMPAEFDADKRVWLRVGVKAQNTTDEDITAYLTVENAEIRGRRSDEASPDSITFEAEILEIRDGYFLVKPEAGWAINSATLLEVPMENMEPSPALQVGDVIEITYDGRILETDPGRIHTVYRIRIAEEPVNPRAYESGGNVRERENAPDDMEWQDGISFSDLAPGGEIVSPFEIVMEKNDSSLWLSITWTRNGQALEYGIRSEDGTAFFQEKQGGSSLLLIEEIPAGTYRLYVKNPETFNALPANESSESFNASGALVYSLVSR